MGTDPSPSFDLAHPDRIHPVIISSGIITVTAFVHLPAPACTCHAAPTPTCELEAVLTRFPLSVRVLAAYGIARTPGVSTTLRDAAAAAGVDVAEVLDAISTAVTIGA